MAVMISKCNEQLFVTSEFIGMSLESALSSLGFRHWQWTEICAFEAALPALMLIHLLVKMSQLFAR
ncbi:hypothetical protein A1122_21347 (plasmid) [Yersinia pestis A1122]|nr:hypothetical protein A1122_21347 [Yersinia pestis A1122]AJJ29800.1 hypothetical protein CH61_4380 [Yersinia pestis]EFA45788.1 conserved hypothetical protein [Yersinia pestis KIM D27]EIR98487.1 hypothetical protein YPPY42_4891 [Yersinia pestis PY-42]EIS35073.1 hypothetical protein YPPY58_4901 [Yersinia pestis PY-58]EIS82335.1 hypothetical protein YPPY76_4609 [Yersinia pestis PY-76]KNC64840.1 hypothetical protein M485_4163 [Yersinia pestis 14735]